MKKTYKSFGEALDELRVEAELSYDRLSLKVGITQSYLYYIINRRADTAPNNKIIEKIAKFFGLEPEYFFEFRLRKMIDFVNDNREFLDHCEKESRKFKKGVSPALPESDTEEGESA